MSRLCINSEEALQLALTRHEERKEPKPLDRDGKPKCPRLGPNASVRLVECLRENEQRYARGLSSAGVRPL